MGQYSAKETILKLRECIIPHPRKDEMVNKLSHDTTVPLIHTQLFSTDVKRIYPYHAKGALPRFEPVLTEPHGRQKLSYQ
jgi:hypothetical protein